MNVSSALFARLTCSAEKRGELEPSNREHLGYTTSLLDGRATLTQRCRLLVSGGWLSLLAATLLVDLHQERPAIAYLRTAEQLARETCHAEICAWVLETRAWQALTSGEYRRALELSRAAQQAAPHGSSAHIQATAQEGRAWARLGDAGETRASLAMLERLVSPLAQPAARAPLRVRPAESRRVRCDHAHLAR